MDFKARLIAEITDQSVYLPESELVVRLSRSLERLGTDDLNNLLNLIKYKISDALHESKELP